MGTEALEKRKQFLFFGILIVGFIGLVAASPTIYAIVEPHITINMDPGQTTKPFVINDDTGTEVFSVDVDGTTTAGDLTAFEFFQKETLQFTGDGISNRVTLAKWRLTWDLDAASTIKKTTQFSNGAWISGEIRSPGQTGGAIAGAGLGVVSIAVTNGGSGYTSAPTVSFSAAGGVKATATANISGGVVTSVTVDTSGSNIQFRPNITFSGGGGSGAAATASLGIVVVNVIDGGQNFVTPPPVTFSGSGCPPGPTATANISGGKVTSITVTNTGSGCTSSPFTTLGDPLVNVRAEFRVYETDINNANYETTLFENRETFSNQIDEIFPDQIGFDETVDFLVIELLLYADEAGVVGEVRNLSATLLMRIPDFITVERIL